MDKAAKQKAIDWFVRRYRGEFGATEQARFEAWLAAASAHRRANAEVERV